MLINETCGIINFVVDHEEQILLRRMLCDLRICVLLVGRHVEKCLFTSGKVGRRCLVAYRGSTRLTRGNGKGPKRCSLGEGGEAGRLLGSH
jgi:hypothetical protein